MVSPRVAIEARSSSEGAAAGLDMMERVRRGMGYAAGKAEAGRRDGKSLGNEQGMNRMRSEVVGKRDESKESNEPSYTKPVGSS